MICLSRGGVCECERVLCARLPDAPQPRGAVVLREQPGGQSDGLLD